MSSENKTQNIGLNQWEGNEYVKRQDFVDDNLIIDAEIKNLQDATVDIGNLANQAFQSGIDRKNQAIVNINSVGGDVDDSMQFSEILDEILVIETGVDTSDATATAADILAPKSAYVKDKKVIGAIPSKAAATITPGTTEQKILAGQYLSGDQTISAVAGLSAANVAQGKVVGGVTGSYKGLGNAIASQVLAGILFSTAALSNAAGTMPNRGAPNQTLTTQGGQYNIPAGYYSGGSVKAQFTNLAPQNVRDGVNIGGQVGTYGGEIITNTLVEINKTTRLNLEEGIRTTVFTIPAEFRRHFLITIRAEYNYATSGLRYWRVHDYYGTRLVNYDRDGSSIWIAPDIDYNYSTGVVEIRANNTSTYDITISYTK